MSSLGGGGFKGILSKFILEKGQGIWLQYSKLRQT